MKKEEQEDSWYKIVESYLARASKELFSAITSLIIAVVAFVTTIIDASQNFELIVQQNKNEIFLTLAAVAITLFVVLLAFQLIIIKRKKNAKIEKLKSNMIDKYMSAIEQSFVNPKNN